jgi:hypothetical protein
MPAGSFAVWQSKTYKTDAASSQQSRRPVAQIVLHCELKSGRLRIAATVSAQRQERICTTVRIGSQAAALAE